MKKDKKVIVHVVQHLCPGGIEVLALNMHKHSNEQTFIVSLEGTKKNAIRKWPALEAHKDNIIFLNKKSGRSLKAILALCVFLRRLKADVVHTHHIGPLLYGGVAAKLTSIKVLVHTEHDAWHLKERKSYRLQKRLLTFLKPRIIADAHHVASELRSFFPELRPVVIHNGIDTKVFKPFSKALARQCLGLPKQGKIIGCAARLERVKGHDVLISAFAQITDKDIYLVLAGSGSLRTKLEAQAKSLGLERRVIFLGHVDNMSMFYNAIDVFCLASYQEGFPLSPLEAQACGLPCVLTNVGGCGETINQNSGVLVEPGNIQELFDGLRQSLKIKNKKAIRKFITQHADISIMSRKYCEVYVEC